MDAAEVEGVVQHRREEVRGRDDRAVAVQLVDRGVVRGLVPHEHSRVLRRRQLGEQRAELGGGQLAGAAGAV